MVFSQKPFIFSSTNKGQFWNLEERKRAEV